jgi:four helix bundle protein
LIIDDLIRYWKLEDWSNRKLFYRYARGLFEETKAWLRKLIRHKIIKECEVITYTKIIDELRSKLNAFIRSTK